MNENLRIVTLEDSKGNEIMSVLSSVTTREVYPFLQDEPKTPAEFADGIDTSTQNVHYHLRKLRDANLIMKAKIKHSKKNIKMRLC